jgi:outer membrane protein TolC
MAPASLRYVVLIGFLSVAGCSSVVPFRSQVDWGPAPRLPNLAPSTPLADTVGPKLPANTPLAEDDRPLPISLSAALKLGDVRALDVAAAAERVRVAEAALSQAQVLWLPCITLGGDYNRHDGKQQDTSGNVFNNNRSSMMFGVGTGIGQSAIVDIGSAIFTPLVARQRLAAREADRRAAANDTLLAIGDAYFNVQQARGELAGAIDATRRSEELLRITRQQAKVIVAELEVFRVETELARWQEAELLARERWKVASAELLRILRLDPATQVEPTEPPQLRVDLIDLDRPLDELIPIGLTYRPELASQQATVQATLTLLKQERLRPLIPSLLLRGFSTPVTGTLAAGVFGGGSNSSIGSGGLRSDVDVQLLWQLDNLGFGNVAKVQQRDAENRLAVIDLFRIQDRVAKEVAEAHAQAQLGARRVAFAEKGIRAAVESADKNLLVLRQTKAIGDKGALQVTLVVRPQEAVASVQALSQAYVDYFAAVADANRAQFRLYRALGQPAQCLLREASESGVTPPSAARFGTPITVTGTASSHRAETSSMASRLTPSVVK